jgi:flagellar hook-associated protein 2
VGTGTLTIQFGSYSGGAFTANASKSAVSIAIPAASSSLAGVRDAINAANAGVTASIVNDGSSYRLVLGATDTGEANALRISVADDDGNATNASGLSRLAYDASTGGTQNLTQTTAARNAAVVLDGISLTRSSNTISDALDGVTLTLNKPTDSETTLSVTRDTAAAQAAAGRFVQTWNQAISTLSQLGAYDAQKKQGAVLQGDATLLAIQNRLRSVINQPVFPATGGLASLVDIGIRSQADGTLIMDSTKLTAALNDPTKNLAALFGAVGKTSDSLVNYVTAGDAAKPGSYALSVSQLATHGCATGSTAAGLTITAGVNDTLSLSVDGTATTVKLAAGTYTTASLAAQLQSAINGDSTLSSAGSSVSVTTASGILSICSSRYGSSSSVTVSGGNAASSLLGTATSTAGVDVAGQINGVPAKGVGQSLTGAGLTLQVNGGATGPRGNVTYSLGFAQRLSTLIGGFLASDGLIAARTTGINQSLKVNQKQQDALSARLTDIETRYRQQFTKLDTMIASMNSTSTFLTNQLAALPGAATTSKK